jgi:AhpD family alkylhydroperoxidase
MDTLTTKERELVALGAALGSNCVPRIEYHVPEARKAGLSDQQISEAIELADTVRQVPARKVLETAVGLLAKEPAAAQSEPRVSGGSQSATGFAPWQRCCG